MWRKLTWISNLDLHIAAVQRRVVKVEAFLQPIKVVELDISKALRPLQLAVLDDPNALNATSLEEILESLHGRVIGEVPDMGGIGGPGGKGRGGGAARRACTLLERKPNKPDIPTLTSVAAKGAGSHAHARTLGRRERLGAFTSQSALSPSDRQ